MVNKSTKILLIGLAGLLWLLVSVIGYYYTHKPFTAALLAGLLRALWQVTVAGLIVSLSGGIGTRILNRKNQIPRLFLLSLQAALGLGIISLITLVIGATLGFLLPLFAVITLAGIWLLRGDIRDWWRGWLEMRNCWIQGGRFGRLIAVGAGVIFICALCIALAPPLRFDALTYHLSIPRAYLLAGRATYLPDNMFWGMPQQTEMLYTLAMLFGGIEAAAVLGWCFGIITLAGLLGYAADRLGVRAGWAAAACLLAGATFSASLGWGYTEWPVMLYGLGMMILLEPGQGEKSTKSLALAGVFAGMALGTKYTAGILLVIGLVLVLVYSLRTRGRAIFPLVIFFGAAVLSASPWWIKNALATGNPFYPLLFPSGAMDSLRLSLYQGNLVYKDWRAVILLPWQATVWGVEGGEGYSASIGALLLGFSLLAGIGWRSRKSAEQNAISHAALITLLGFLIWAVASRISGLLIQTRLYAAFFPAWAVLGAAGYTALAKIEIPALRFGRLAGVLILLVFGLNVFETGLQTLQTGAFEALFRLRTSREYLAGNLGQYSPAMEAIQSLPATAHVLMLWETRSLDCLPQCDPDEVIDNWFHDIRTLGSPQAALESWQKQGYTHLLYYRLGAEFVRHHDLRYTGEDWEALEALFAKLPPPIIFGDIYLLYELGPSK